MHTRKQPTKEMQQVLESLPDESWTVCDSGPDFVTSFAVIDVAGEPTRVERTQYFADALLQEANRQQYNDSEGKRWKDGRVAARVPMNKWLSELGPKAREGDRDHLKWWLAQPENLPFRTFKGRI